MLFFFIFLHILSRKNFFKKSRKFILLFLIYIVEYTRKQQERVRKHKSKVCLPNITHHFPPYHKVTSRSVMLWGVIFYIFFKADLKKKETDSEVFTLPSVFNI